MIASGGTQIERKKKKKKSTYSLKQRNQARSTCAESTNTGVNQAAKDRTQTTTAKTYGTLTYHASKYKVHKLHVESCRQATLIFVVVFVLCLSSAN